MTPLLYRRSAYVLTLAAVLAVARFVPAHAQAPATAPAAGPANTSISIRGDVPQPLTVTLAELKTMPRTTVTIDEEDGRQTHYEGVLVAELLRRAGAPVGRDMMRNGVASYVKASARDGFQAVFSLAELDPTFTSNDIIIADSVDGKPLFDYQGPFRIVAPKDKRGARGVRMLTQIEVVRLVK